MNYDIQSLDKKLNRIISGSGEVKKAAINQRNQMMADMLKEFSRSGFSKNEIQRYLYEEDGLAKALAHPKVINKYVKVLDEKFQNQSKGIKTIRGRKVFRGVSLDYTYPTRTNVRDRGSEKMSLEQKKSMVGKNSDKYDYDVPMYFFGVYRAINIYLDGNNMSGGVEKYKPLNYNASPLYKPSAYPKTSEHPNGYDKSIYLPYYINNQPVNRKNNVYWFDKDGNKRYGRRRWHDISDKDFMQRVIKNFKRDDRIPSWVRVELGDVYK